MTIKLILCLRNPGSAYEQTRHNAGAWFALKSAQHYNASFKIDKKLQAEIAVLNINDQACRLAMPLTFMNHSGQPARAISQFYQIAPEEILVIHDEIDLIPGRIKLKTGGGHGGHNGLRDIVSQLASTQFHRMRIGVGHPGHSDLVAQYVLNKASQQDRQHIYDAIDRGIAVLPFILAGDLARAMNQLNT